MRVVPLPRCAAFATVVVRKACVRYPVCEASSGVHGYRARLTLANCRGDTGNPVCVAVCLPAVWVSVMPSEKFPETLPRSGCVWRDSGTVLQGTSVNDK